jgi:hypothetical protein
MLTPPAVSLPLLRWAQWPLSVPCRLDTPAYRLESNTRKTYCHMPYNAGCCLPVREGSGTATCHVALDPTSLLGRAPMLPHVPRLWILPPCSGGLQRCHMSCCSGSCLPTREGTGAATCPATIDPASLLGRAPTLPCVTRLWILPPCSGGLRCCHVSRDSGSCLPTQEGSGTATCPAAPDLASLLERALALPHVLRL